MSDTRGRTSNAEAPLQGETLERLSGSLRSSWHQFLDVAEPLRPELYRYCRHLTGTPWDAEDLVQDALARAFATLGTVFHPVTNVRAWLFKVASNAWIDQVRRHTHERSLLTTPLPESDPGAPRLTREAAGTLLAALSPQERAAVVLKDVFDFSLAEVADALSTSTGAVKAALHRGRDALSSVRPVALRQPNRLVLDAFCDAFNARDLSRLTALLLENATVEIVGVVTEYGPDEPADPRTGSFAGTLAPITFDDRGGVPPERLTGYRGAVPNCDARDYQGCTIVLFWYEHDQGSLVRTVMTVETEGDRLRRVRNYFFSPDVLGEVCTDLHVPHATNGYRYW